MTWNLRQNIFLKNDALKTRQSQKGILPKTNIAHEKWWLEDYFVFFWNQGTYSFSGVLSSVSCVSMSPNIPKPILLAAELQQGTSSSIQSTQHALPCCY